MICELCQTAEATREAIYWPDDMLLTLAMAEHHRDDLDAYPSFQACQPCETRLADDHPGELPKLVRLMFPGSQVLGLGLLFAVGTAVSSLAFGLEVLESSWLDLYLPILGELHLGTSTLFDIGVYLIVIGLTLDILRSLGGEVDRHGEEAEQGDGVVVLTDLGSAVMTAEMTLEFLSPDTRSRIRLPQAALVEGAVAAAVQAESGGTVDEVASAAERAVVSIDPESLEPFVSHGAAAPGPSAPLEAAAEPAVTGAWTLPNKMGLHARPAAVIARALTDLDAEVTINGVDGKSVMLLMSLALGEGKELRAEATGPEAQKAIEYIGGEVKAGFGEL